MRILFLEFFSKSNSAFSLIVSASPVVKFVVLILVITSFISWVIIVAKYLFLKRTEMENSEFLDVFWSSSTLDDVDERAKKFTFSPAAKAFRSGYREVKRVRKYMDTSGTSNPTFVKGIDNVKRAMEKEFNKQKLNLERYLTFLATTGNTAPFVGLFGTVWGVMDSFRSIALTGNPSLSTVAPGISEALITTAIGLFTAIPAVVAYNYLLEKVKGILTEMDYFVNDFLNIVERHLL